MWKFRCTCGRQLSDLNPNDEYKYLTKSIVFENKGDELHGDVIISDGIHVFECSNCGSLYIRWDNTKNRYYRYAYDIEYNKDE